VSRLCDSDRLVDVRIIRCELFGLLQLAQTVLGIAGVQVDEAQVFAQVPEGSASSANLNSLFEL